MANTVKSGEGPARVIASGNYTYLLYPDFGITVLSEAGWAVKRIDESDANDVKIQWAGGSIDKVYPADNLSGLTYKNL